MTFKRLVSSLIVLCITVTVAVTVCGCDDLGVYADTAEYYDSFGQIVLVNSNAPKGNSTPYSVSECFYNEDSRENFLENRQEDLVPSLAYVYMAIPIKSDMEMDDLALYMRGEKNQSVYLNVYITDKIPSNWRAIGDPETQTLEKDGQVVEEKIKYDDPDPDTSIADAVVHLKASVWSSFLIESFEVNKAVSSTLAVEDGQYLLIQFRNNSGVPLDSEEDEAVTVVESEGEIEPAYFTMTNLLVRAMNRSGEGEE